MSGRKDSKESNQSWSSLLHKANTKSPTSVLKPLQ
jgi:hypothetical protein